MKSFKNVEMINLGIEREFYTKHGQHLNTRERKNVDENSLHHKEHWEKNETYQCEMEK
jgi:hypothetical protein